MKCGVFNKFVWITNIKLGTQSEDLLIFFEILKTLATKDAYLMYVFRVGVRKYRDGIFLEGKKSKYCMACSMAVLCEKYVWTKGNYKISRATLK